MNHFDEIIGYSAIKKELEIIADILENNEFYKNSGARTPRGLLLHGEPGLGKSLMAKCLIEESGRAAITCRKDKPDGEFVKYIREAFEKAKESAPSIVFLDDMDKFANGDEVHTDSEEYVAVQSGIDDVKDCEVFVLATANNIDCLPESLLRPGRFDRVIEVERPSLSDSGKIIEYYLRNKNISDDVDIGLMARLLEGNTCAEAETVINEAGIHAAFERSGKIEKEHFLKACLKIIFSVSNEALENRFFAMDKDKKTLAYHEAGHAVIHEVLYPESVNLAAIFRDESKRHGFVSAKHKGDGDPVERKINEVIIILGGMAATDYVFGKNDGGSMDDMRRAFRSVGELVSDYGLYGLCLHNAHRNYWDNSEHLQSKQENAISCEVEKLFHKAKEIIADNSGLLHAIAGELMKNDILDMYDIERIKKNLQ